MGYYLLYCKSVEYVQRVAYFVAIFHLDLALSLRAQFKLA
jgi:hypothetical protein